MWPLLVLLINWNHGNNVHSSIDYSGALNVRISVQVIIVHKQSIAQVSGWLDKGKFRKKDRQL